MAGSYRHVTNSDGSFRGADLLENGGDTYEAVEEMHATAAQQRQRGHRRGLVRPFLGGLAMTPTYLEEKL